MDNSILGRLIDTIHRARLTKNYNTIHTHKNYTSHDPTYNRENNNTGGQVIKRDYHLEINKCHNRINEAHSTYIGHKHVIEVKTIRWDDIIKRWDSTKPKIVPRTKINNTNLDIAIFGSCYI